MKERLGIRTTLEENVLLELFLESGHDPEVRGVFLTGGGEAFSAGGDLSLAQSLRVGTEDHKEGVRAARERRRPSFTGR
jgi:enoyl-CoA hydratase/carnithine racemase